MTSSYDLGKAALALFRSRNGDESLRNQCIRFDGWYWSEAYQGNENIRSYPSATAAADASPMYTTDVNDPRAQPGDPWYFHYAGLGNAGHVGTVLGHDTDGRVLVTHTSSSGDLVEQWTNNVRISHADTIPHKFRGGSHHYGSNKQRRGLTSWPAPANQKKGAFVMPALIRTPDGSIGFVSDAGTLDAISSLNEVESLKASGLVGNWVQLQDRNIWDTLTARTARLRAQQAAVDPSKLATEIAALMVGPVVEAVADAGGLTQEDVEAAVETVTKRILAKAAA